jgi:hypothetical protein
MHKCSICNNWVKGHYTDSAELIDSVLDVRCMLLAILTDLEP